MSAVRTQGLTAYASMQTEADAGREAQIALERLLAAKKAKVEAAHLAMTEPRVDTDSQPSAEEPAESEPSWLSLIAGTVATLVTWAVFGWAVVTVAAALVGGAK